MAFNSALRRVRRNQENRDSRRDLFEVSIHMEHDMKTAGWYILAASAMVLGSACSTSKQIGGSSSSRPRSDEPAHQLGRVEGRTWIIVVHSDIKEPRYTLSTTQGDVLLHEASLNDIQMHFPQLYWEIRSALASKSALMVADKPPWF